MAYVDEKSIVLDSEGNAKWEINLVAPIGGTYQGIFEFRTVLSPIQLIEADRDYRELLGKNLELLGTHVDNLSYTLSQLKQRIIKSPPFWDNGGSRFPGSHIRDEEILQAVYEAAIMAETKFRASLKEKHKASLDRLKAVIEAQEEEDRLNAELEQDDIDNAQPKGKAKFKKKKMSEE